MLVFAFNRARGRERIQCKEFFPVYRSSLTCSSCRLVARACRVANRDESRFQTVTFDILVTWDNLAFVGLSLSLELICVRMLSCISTRQRLIWMESSLILSIRSSESNQILVALTLPIVHYLKKLLGDFFLIRLLYFANGSCALLTKYDLQFPAAWLGHQLARSLIQ